MCFIVLGIFIYPAFLSFLTKLTPGHWEHRCVYCRTGPLTVGHWGSLNWRPSWYIVSYGLFSWTFWSPLFWNKLLSEAQTASVTSLFFLPFKLMFVHLWNVEIIHRSILIYSSLSGSREHWSLFQLPRGRLHPGQVTNLPVINNYQNSTMVAQIHNSLSVRLKVSYFLCTVRRVLMEVTL